MFHTRSLNDSKRILRELVLLRHLGGHGDITWIQDIMVYPNQRDFRDVYIVSDLMEGALHPEHRILGRFGEGKLQGMLREESRVPQRPPSGEEFIL